MSLVIGIAGSLFGVIVGAFLTRWIDASYQRRREVEETIAAALVLREELKDAEAGLRSMGDMKRLAPSYLFAGIGEWDSHRHLLLAAGMAHSDWGRLARLFRKLLESREGFKALNEAQGDKELDDEAVKYLETTAEDCVEGRALLEPFVVEATRVPLIQPARIFRINSGQRWWSFAPLGMLGRIRQ